MSKVRDDETVLVRFLALDADAVAADAAGVQHAPRVDAHVDLVVLELDEALGRCGVLVDVVDESICGTAHEKSVSKFIEAGCSIF